MKAKTLIGYWLLVLGFSETIASIVLRPDSKVVRTSTSAKDLHHKARAKGQEQS